jgi:hypothetical protein
MPFAMLLQNVQYTLFFLNLQCCYVFQKLYAFCNVAIKCTIYPVFFKFTMLLHFSKTICLLQYCYKMYNIPHFLNLQCCYNIFKAL